MSTRRSPKGDSRKAELIAHALACLTEKGYSDTSMRDIAVSARLNLGRLHYYFDSKADLLLAAIQRYKGSLSGRLEDLLSQDLEPQVLRDSYIRTYAAAAANEAEIHRLSFDVGSRSLFDPSLHKYIDELGAEFRGILKHLLDKIGAPSDDDAVMRTYYVINGYFLSAIAKSLRGEPDVEAMVYSQLDRAIPKIAATTADPP